MIKQKIKNLVVNALEGWLESNAVSGIAFTVDIPPKEFEADLSSNIALMAAKRLKKNPMSVAEEISRLIEKNAPKGVIGSSSAAAPGFINLKLSNEYLLDNFVKLINSGFRQNELAGENVCVEFVSANPTGPLHVGHGRGAAIGDSLARVYEHFGAKVVREYYVNNIGNQIGILGSSVKARVDELKGEPAQFPSDGYQGDYIKDMARAYIQKGLTENFNKYAYEAILTVIKADLEKFRVVFNEWTFESALHDSGLMDETIDLLKQKGVLFENEGALWLRSTEHGDEKDRVVKRSDGRYTYLAGDMAYHKNKISRGFTRLVDIWGADHYGYQKRLEYVVKTLGLELEKFNIILYQLVRLMRGGEIVPMSTRSGEFVTLSEVVDEVGADACRFFFLLRSPESHLDFDLELAKKNTADNPVYYVQYAHARICSIFKEAASRNLTFEGRTPDLNLLAQKQEMALIKQAVFFPDLLNACLRDSTPHYLTSYLIETVKKFHSFYDSVRVITDTPELTQSRLYLINGIKSMIQSALNLLGVSSPETMQR